MPSQKDHTDDDSEDEEEAENRKRQKSRGGKWRVEGMKAVAQARLQQKPELARGALVQGTLTRHEAVLQKMHMMFPWTASVEDMVCLSTTALADLVAEYLKERQKQGDLKWSSVESEGGSLMGALSRRGRDIPKESVMKDVMITIKRNSAKEIIDWPMVFTPREVDTMIKLATGELKMFLILAFGGAMRAADLFSTSPKDTLVFKSHVALLVRGGKATKETAKTVHIRTGLYHADVQWFIQKKRAEKAQSHFNDSIEFRTRIKAYLRETCPTASLRSFRSTTIITMGLIGAPASTIQQLATHTSPGTTQRYLRFGVANAHAAFAQKGTAMLELLGHNEEEPGDFYFNSEKHQEEDT
jgi:integrase